MQRQAWPGSTWNQKKQVVTIAQMKLSTYSGTLGWTPAQVTAFDECCDEILAVFTFYDNSRTSMNALTGWREQVFYGQPRGSVAIPAPEFTTPPDMTFHNGVFDTFINFRNQILANPNYTISMGEDMMLIGAEIAPVPPSEVEPQLKVSTSGEPSLTGTDTVSISGSMQGNSSMKVLWTPKGGVTREVATITSTPANITITKTDPNEPESGMLQAQYYNKNLPYGNPSPIYPITLA